MNKPAAATKIRSYCAQCAGWCPVIAEVKEGVFAGVSPDTGHPLFSPLCPKGLAAPELVYNGQRLQYPMRRTNPREDADPGWQRIGWDEALDTIAGKLNRIKAEYGPEAVAFSRSGPGGSPMAELAFWVIRLAHAFGSPNNIGTTNICQWHRDNCSSYTYARPGIFRANGRAEFEQSACILIWGVNIHATRTTLLPLIRKGMSQGARLIVVDPRKIELAGMADLWLPLKPGTDGALILSMINVMLEEKLYDDDFVRDWTSAPFIVKKSTGEFLRADELVGDGDRANYVMADSKSGELKAYAPGTKPAFEPALTGTYAVTTASGKKVEGKTVFQLLTEAVSGYSPRQVERITGIAEGKIREATRMMATMKPSCWYSWLGIEETTNASQTNRALCILYALTGNYDVPGGNIIPPRISMNPVDGSEFLSPETEAKRLGFKQRPLGPSGATARTTQGYEVYRAVLEGKPYPVKALVGFGGNLVTSNIPGLPGIEALKKLDFHVQAELFMTPTARFADIVLPVASCWESWHVGVNTDSLSKNAVLQLRPAVVPPQHESWPDMKIIFKLASRLGLGDKFWDGDAEAAFNHQFAPLHVTVEQLKKSPGGIKLELDMKYRKYRQKDSAGNFTGLPTPTKRVELYSITFGEHGYAPLPTWQEPDIFKREGVAENYPVNLINSKVLEYCHSQHRALPSLRERVPHPYLEINVKKASELGIKDGEWVMVETPYGGVTVQARPTEGIPYNVVCTQNGWWQSCPELGLPGYDPYTSRGANVVLLYSDENMDPISGSLLVKGHPCRVRKITEQV